MTSLTNKKVLVTGAGGFIGSHLVEALLADGNQVTALYRYNSENRIGKLQELEDSKNLNLVPGDIRNPHQLLRMVEGQDVIFHLAALIGIPYSADAPTDYVDTNCMGTLNLLEAAKTHQIKRVVVTSTSEVYGTPKTVPITEGHPLLGQSPYSASKIGADQLAYSFYCCYDLPVVILRPFNTFGPRQSMRAVIPTIIGQLLNGSSIEIGNLKTERDFLFVKDTVNGFLQAGSVNGIEGDTIHLGSGEKRTIQQVIDEIGVVLGVTPKVTVNPDRVRKDRFEVEELLADASKAHSKLRWKPTVSFQDGIRQTVSYIKSHPESYSTSAYVK